MAILDDAKQRLRLDFDDFDAEVTDLIDAGVADLIHGGVHKTVMAAWELDPNTDKLLKYAVLIYVKNNFGWNNPDYDKLNLSYKTLKGEITLSDEYIKEVV